MQLVIVESPAKAKTIEKYLGPGFKVLASYGHIRDLPPKDGSVDPENGFEMLWDNYADKAKQLKAITDEAKKADGLILATDPDREGEAISWHVQEVLAKKKALPANVGRVTFNAITKQAVTDAMKHPRALDIDLIDAYRAALECDSVSAFGGIVAVNRPLDAATAEAITEIFTEVVAAPSADDAAKAVFAKKKNLRLLLTGELPDPKRSGLSIKPITGGLLVQSRDNGHVADSAFTVVTKRAPSAQELADCRFAWTIAKHVKSNAIVYAKDGATAGIGAGQMNRRDSARIAAIKAKEAAETYGWAEPRTVGSAVASDAFFPFADGLLTAAEAGATAVIQPGGSMRDDEVIAAADEAGLAMVFTGMRHFRH